MFDYEEYEKECDRIRKDNGELLSLFEDDLTNAGLSSKTIRRHLSNVDFYINEYLLREEPLTIEYGTAKLDTFLGDFFDGIKDICISYMLNNYDLCYLRAMHDKNSTIGADTIIVGSSHTMNGIIESELHSAGDVIQFSISSQDLYYDLQHIKKLFQKEKGL